MCRTMQNVLYSMNYFSGSLCNITDEECTDIRCDVPAHPVSMHVTPCDVPPSLQFNVFVNGHTQIIFADGNQTTALSDVDGTLQIIMWQSDYSMDVEVSCIQN